MHISDLLKTARQQRASDVHITVARNPMLRIDGSLHETEYNFGADEKRRMIFDLLTDKQKKRAEEGIDIDTSYETDDGMRHRVNVYFQQQRIAAAIRLLNDRIPTFEDLMLPEAMRALAEEPRGLILVTGPTGSGKSTSLAAMVDHVNSTKACHILTIEDPVEYVYKQKKALIHQRNVGEDVPSFSDALRSAMREDPDVILVGEMRDFETIAAAITAAETGHLVLSTLHTTGAAMTVDRIIDVFPEHGKHQIRTQLAGVLKGVITQTLIPRMNTPGRVAAFEIMLGTDAVSTMIRESKGHQLNSVIQTSTRMGMMLLDDSLANLVRNGTISKDAALEKATNKAEFLSSLTRM